MRADFGDWQVIPGGDGPIVRMALPMKNLAGSYELNGQTHKLSCDELTGVIEIKLGFKPHDHSVPIKGPDGKPLPGPASGTKRHKLMVRTKSNSPADPVVTFYNMEFTKPLSPVGIKTSVESEFLAWCQANLEKFAHIFAIVDLNDKVATGAWSFCHPYKTNYAYVDRG